MFFWFLWLMSRMGEGATLAESGSWSLGWQPTAGLPFIDE